jgi:hypothetical protein
LIGNQTLQTRALNRLKQVAVEKEIKERNDKEYELTNERKMNRISYRNWENQVIPATLFFIILPSPLLGLIMLLRITTHFGF